MSEAKKKNIKIDHVKKTVEILISPEKLSTEDNILVADLVSRGYEAKQRVSKQSGRNKEWFRNQLPNDAARAHFDEICDKRKGLGGWRKAIEWAKPEIVKDQLPNDAARAEFENIVNEDGWLKARNWAKKQYKVEI